MAELSKEALDKIKERLGEDAIRENEPMISHLSMRVGGPARYFITPSDADETELVIKILQNEGVPYYILGNGTNVIVRDFGFEGAIIQLLDRFQGMEVCGNTIRAKAGVKLVSLANEALKNSLAGLEFASGIPGSVGGALVMNAGAYGGEMKDVVKTITFLTEAGEVKTIDAKDADLSYRHSMFSDGGYIILEAEFELEKGEPSQIKAMMDDFNGRRRDKQPLEHPSCGSTFKRPEGYFAGKLIEDSGLKGARIGGASVSEKHCGFVVNDMGGSAQDVLDLIEIVKKTVKEKQGVDLECEVKIL